MIPIVFGESEETDVNTCKLIKNCAKFSAVHAENTVAKPLSNDDSSVSLYHIICTQFKREMRVMVTRTAAKIKIQRWDFIRFKHFGSLCSGATCLEEIE